MSKKIIISVGDKNHKIDIEEGLSIMQVLGLLRFYEKYLWVKVANDAQRQEKEFEENKNNSTDEQNND